MSKQERKTILLVDDEVIIAVAEARTIEAFGYRVLTAKSGEKAVEIATGSEKPDLILMDIDLGKGISGPEAAAAILSRNTIPIVFLTSHSEREMVDTVRGITRYGYVIKNSGDFVLQSSIEMAFELFAAHQKMKESEEKYSAAFRTTPDAVNINSMDGRYVDINEGFTKLSGYTRDEVIGKLSSEIKIWAVPEDRSKLVKELNETSAVDDLESTFRSKDGSLRICLMSARIITFNGYPHILSIARDITERRRTQQALEDESVRRRLLFEQSPDAILIIDPSTARFLEFNTSAHRQLGYTREEFATLTIFDIEAREKVEETRGKIAGVIRSGRVDFETLQRTKDGEIRNIYVTAQITHVQGSPVYYCVWRDITEHKQTEDKLRHNEERMRDVVFSMGDWLWEVDEKGIYTYSSQRGSDLLGRAHEKIIGKTPFDFMSPEEAKRVSSIFSHIAAEKAPIRDLENWNQTRSGQEICLLTNGVPILDKDGNLKGYRGVDKDITQWKRAESQITEYRERLDFYVEHSPMAVVEWDSHVRVTRWTGEAERMFGWSSGETLGKPMMDLHMIHESDIPIVQAAMEKLVSGKHNKVISANRNIRKDGSVIQCEWYNTVMMNEQGTMLSVLSMVLDTTERKQAEERLKDERNLLSTIINAIPDEIAVKDLERRFVLVNPPCVRALGKSSADEVVGKRDEDLIAKEFSEIGKLEEESVFSTGKPVLNMEGMPRPDPITGEINRAILISKSPIRDRNGAITGLVVINRNITERKRSEDASHKLEQQFRLVWEHSTDGMRLTNEEGTILRVNEAFCRMVGKERFDLEAHSLAVIYEKERQDHVSRRHRERFRSRTVETHFEREVILWNGRKMWVEVSNSFLEFAGQPSLLLGIFHDITERKRAEARIETLFAEREVLLKEVHHRIKNNMNTMMSLLSLQTKSMTDPGAVAALNDARRRMQSMMVLYDRLYRSEGFRELSAKEYLVPLVSEIIDNFPNKEIVTIEMHVEDFIIDIERLSPLGIIINELITNIMKHAFVGWEKGVISIAASMKENHATVSVQDNGIGLPEGFNAKTSTGFGLRLVDMLTEQIGGSMRIEREKGTRFILEFDV